MRTYIAFAGGLLSAALLTMCIGGAVKAASSTPSDMANRMAVLEQKVHHLESLLATGDVTSTASLNSRERTTMESGKRVMISAGDDISLITCDASLMLKKDGKIVLKGKSITIEGDVAGVKPTSDIQVKGAKATEN
jgi:type VI secretion system secreted protein VgrG